MPDIDIFENVPTHSSIDHIIKEFNFNKVKDHMQTVNWTWYLTDSGESPSLTELKNCAIRLLTAVRADPLDSCSLQTGGFAVYKIDGILSLHFYVEHADEYDVFDEYGNKY